eukprot:9357773-Alexandrium_andersonii.AAC.1
MRTAARRLPETPAPPPPPFVPRLQPRGASPRAGYRWPGTSALPESPAPQHTAAPRRRLSIGAPASRPT